MAHHLLSFLLACTFFFQSQLVAEGDPDGFISKSSEPLLGYVDSCDNRGSLTNLEAEPSTHILNVVSVISGDYTDSTTDYIIPGPDPLPIQRVYSSGERGNGSICYGWHWGKNGFLSMSEVNAKKDKFDVQALVVGGGGSRMTYLEGKNRNFILRDKCYRKGLTNTSSGVISARTNPLNDTLTADKKYDTLTLTSGGGVVAEFKRYHDYPFYLLKKEKKTNGLDVVYTHDKKWRLLGVESQNRYGNPLASFTCDIQKNSLSVKTSNNRTVSYQFEKLRNPEGERYYLKKAVRPDRPDESFEYAARDSNSPHRLVKKSHPDGRALGIEYYEKGDNATPFGNVCIKTDAEPRRGRVRALKAPVGHDSTLHTIYKFTYGTKLILVNDPQPHAELSEGTTNVFDVYDHYTTYVYNEDQRLTCVEKNEGQWPYCKLYSKEKLFWEGHKLTNRIFEGRDGSAQYAKQYDYDGKGNVWRETLWGNLSGCNSKPIAYPPSGYPEYNGCEFEFKLFTYSDDGMNLMTSQTEGKAAHTTYAYHPGTDLLASKLTGPIGSVALREYCEYDQNGVLVLQINDDGSSSDRNDLTGVTERRVTRILPNVGVPMGLPVIIEDKYVDLETGYEGFIQRTVQSYTQEGWLSRKELYDQNNIFVGAEKWEYDRSGNVVLYEDLAGRITRKAYDINHNLVREEEPSPDFHMEYEYDYSDRLIKKTVVTNDGQRLSEEYIYDMRSCLVATRDIYGNQTSHQFDEFGRRVKTIFPEVSDEWGNVFAPESETSYSVMSHPATITDPRGFATGKQCTIKGSPYKVLHPDGSTESFTYNVDGTVQKQLHKNGSYSLYEYDYQKRPVKKEIYSSSNELLDATYSFYSGFNLLKETTLGGSEIRYSYDFRGRLVETNQGDLRVRYGHDSLGRKVWAKTYFGPGEDDYIAQVYAYDALNRLVEEREEDSSGNVLKKLQYEYDLAGNRSRILAYTQEGISVTAITYDPYGQPLVTTDAEGNQTVIRNDYTTYNARGQLIPYQEMTDPAGNVVATTKDALGRVATVVKRNSLGQETQRVAFSYDANGNKTRQTDTVYHPDSTSREVVTLWQYDPCNRVVSIVEAAGAPEQKHVQVIYNNEGQKGCVIKADGVQLHFTYDQLGRLLSQHSSDNTLSYRYTYDIRGNTIQVDDLINGCSTIREYDGDDRLTGEVLGNGLAVSYTYDAMGRPLSVSLPDSSSVHYTYQASRLKNVQRCGQGGDPTYVHTYESYGLGGLLLAEKYAGNVGSASYSYDALMRLKTHASKLWSETVHAYDRVGNLLSKTTEDALGVVPSEYEYDDLYQVKKESGATEAVYQWDSLYNRISKDKAVLTYNALNQLIHDGNSAYDYDFNGNLISVRSAEATTRYAYDALDRLVQVTKGQAQYRYGYDEHNRRLTRSVYALVGDEWQVVRTERFLYQSSNEVGLVDGAGELVEYRMLGAGKGAEIGASLLVELKGKAYVPFHDQAGNIVSLVGADSGTLVETYRYSAFGERLRYNANGDEIGVSENPWGFSSKRFDEETGFVYFGRRYYDPALARWITADPIGYDGGRNLYAFVCNNPLTQFDLYGLQAVSDFGPVRPSDLRGGDNTYFPDSGFLQYAKQGLTSLSEGVGYAIHEIGQHCVIVPELQDAVRSVGMYLQNKSMDDFKTWRQNKSCAGNLGLPDMHPKFEMICINGVNTDHETIKNRARDISANIGGFNVNYFYNSTHGLVPDFYEFGVQRCGFDTRSARMFAMDCRKKIEKMGGVDGGGVLLLAGHSQGGEIINNLPKYLTPEELKMIHVRTFGSPIQINDKRFGGVINYVSASDYVPLFNYFRLNRGKSNTVILPSDSLCEHGWDCPTYQKALYNDLDVTFKELRLRR